MVELLDIYDENLKLIGTKPRPEVHRDGDWHRVFHCWVIYRNADGEDWIIVQKRAADKETWPNYLDVSAAGHYESGETIQDGIREIEEELGLSVNFSDLIPVGRRMTTMKSDTVIDCEVADVFLYICNQPLAAYQYQKEEVAGLVAVNVNDGLALFSGECSEIEVPAVGLDTPTIMISPSDFVRTFDDYHYKILILTKRCLDGERHLRV